jgi:dihydroorotase
VVDTPAVVELIHQRARDCGLAHVEVLGALTGALAGEQLAALGALRSAGCVGVSNARCAVRDSEIMRRALEYAATFDLVVHVQPEDPWLAAGRQVHEGAMSTALGLPGIPGVAETIAMSRDLLLVEQTGARVHFGRLSSARAVDLVADARARGLPVSADVAVHQLLLTEEALEGFDGAYHVRPPLRTTADRDRLCSAVAAGTISAICSDHQPHERDAKVEPFPLTEPGISGLDTLVSLVLRLVDSGLLELPRAIAALTSEPGRILGTGAGTLGIGVPADLCVIDPRARWQVTRETIASRGHNTPFLGQTLTGRAALTVLDGRIVHEREGT